MLNAVQENSPVNVVQVLEKVIVSFKFSYRLRSSFNTFRHVRSVKVYSIDFAFCKIIRCVVLLLLLQVYPFIDSFEKNSLLSSILIFENLDIQVSIIICLELFKRATIRGIILSNNQFGLHIILRTA